MSVALRDTGAFVHGLSVWVGAEANTKFVPTIVDRSAETLHADDVICLTIEAKLERSGQ